MQDLSDEIPGGRVGVLGVSSMAGGNRFSRSGRDASMTAPGSETTACAVPEASQPGPFVSATESFDGAARRRDRVRT